MSIAAPMIEHVLDARVLLSVEQACARAAAYVDPIDAEEIVPLARAVGRTLFEEISARVLLPRFDQSAMDGYAIRALSAVPGQALPVCATVAAGDRGGELPEGAAVRILTGAPLPSGADAVVMQEHVVRRGSGILIPEAVRKGDNIRRQGEDIAEGERLFEPGQVVDARHVALLASQGVQHVRVRRRSQIAIVSTGNELRQPGEDLADACIFDINRPMLLSLAQQAGMDVVDGGWIPDDRMVLAGHLYDLSSRVDFIVTTGGVAGGDEDHSSAAVRRAGGAVETLQIALKPGKPAVVGRIGRASYLGLPGNPVSALVSWLLLGRSMSAKLQGRPKPARLGYPVPLKGYFERRPGRTEFVPAKLAIHEGRSVLQILGRGGSARLKPLVDADGLAEIDPEQGSVRSGDVLQFHPFRTGFSL